MKKLLVLLGVLFIILLAFSTCQKQSSVAPDLNQDSVAALLDKAETSSLKLIAQ